MRISDWSSDVCSSDLANPREFLDSISRQTKALCTDLAGKLATVAPTPDDQYVWTLRGDQVVHDKIEAMIADSRDSIWIKAADDVVRRHKDRKSTRLNSSQ